MNLTESEQAPTYCSPAYQQALCDFGVTDLMATLNHIAESEFDTARTNPEEHELELLALWLIQQLQLSLSSHLVIANDHVRSLRQFMPSARFEVMFDTPISLE